MPTRTGNPLTETLTNFGGGINNNSPADQIEDNEIVDGLNVMFDKQSNLQVRPGLTRVNYNKNLLTRTEEFDHADWTKGSVSIIPNTTVAPDSTVSADTLTGTGGGAFNSLQSLTYPVIDNNTYSASIYVKKDISATHSFGLALVFSGGTTKLGRVQINLSTGVVTNRTSTLTLLNYGSEDVGDYWRIYVKVLNEPFSNTSVSLWAYPNISGPVNQSVIIWGAQLERGLLSTYHKNVATAPIVLVNYLTSKITSIFDYRLSNGDNAIIITSGSKIYRFDSTNNYFVDISGGLTFPSDTYWQWVVYDDILIGVNQGSKAGGFDGLVKINGISSNAELIDWNVNYLLYTEQFDDWSKINSPIIENNVEKDVNDEETADSIESIINYLTKTEELDHANWAAINTPIRTSGSIEDDSATNPEGIRQTITVANSEVFVASIYIAKTTSATTFPVLQLEYINGTTPLTAGIIVDTDNGVLIDQSGSVPTDKGIEDANVLSWRVWFKFTNNATGNTQLRFSIYPARSADLSTLDSTLTGIAFFFGAQLEKDELRDYHRNTDSTRNGVYREIIVANSEIYLASIHIKKTSAATHYPVLQLKYINGNTPLTAGVIVDTNNGVLVDQTSNTADAKGIVDEGDYWRVWFRKANNATGNTKLKFEVYPARANALTGALNDLVSGESIFWGAQLEKSSAVTNYHKNVYSSNVAEPPNGRYIEVWNDRIWIVDADNPNTVITSSLGNYQDYATPGKAGSQKFEIGGAEGDNITGLVAHKDRMFIFKSDYTYIVVPGDPNTDVEQYQIILLSKKVGCISAYSIQPILDDVIFLSRNGLVSLQAVEKYGDFENSILSNKVAELNKFSMNEIFSASVINAYDSQYLLAAPLGGGLNNDGLWVLDYSKLNERVVGFTRFNGKILGSSFGSVFYEGRSRVYVGGYPQSDDEDLVYLYRYGDEDIYTDDGSLYNIIIKSKAYNLQDSINSKIFLRVFFVVELLTDEVNIVLSYLFDETSSRIKSWVSPLTGDTFIGAIWDSSTWDSGIWAVQNTLERRINRKVIGSPGRLAKSIQFIISNSVKDQAFIVKSWGFNYEFASRHKV